LTWIADREKALTVLHLREAPVFTERTSVGLDVHARSVVGCGLDTVTGETARRRVVPTFEGVTDWLAELPAPVAVAYEAGPTGFGLARQLTAAGIRCVVAAPSKLQRPPGDRVKTDSRDAQHLAKLLRMDQIVEVRVPSVEQEAARDLVRAREDVRGDLMRSRHRLSKLLLRQGILYSGGHPWTGVHEQWLRGQHFALPGLQLAFDSAFETVLLTAARRDRLDHAITEMAVGSEYTPVVRRLCCLRGVSTLTGFGLAVEIGDWHRFTGSTIGAYLGLVPTESSSGGQRSQGSITKTGNTHARRLLVEAAWHHRKAYRPGLTMRARWDQGAGGGAGPRPRREPAVAPPLGGVHRPEEATGHRRRRHRPGTGRLVLVAGRHARLTPRDTRAPRVAGRRGRPAVRAAHATGPPLHPQGSLRDRCATACGRP
jgi:transposase